MSLLSSPTVLTGANPTYTLTRLSTDSSTFIAVEATCDTGATARLSAEIEFPGTAVSCDDGDSNGFGAPGSPSCTGGSQTDCNDADAVIYPGAIELCNDDDDNCDGATDEDCGGEAQQVVVGGCACDAGGSAAALWVAPTLARLRRRRR